jgi:hypothetical protein
MSKAPEKLKKFSSGATSSESMPHYDSIPVQFLMRLAKIYQEGAEKHERGNFMRGIRSKDYAFLRDRFNHMMNHLGKWRNGENDEDNLAKVIWFFSMAVEAEANGINWSDVLDMKTPEEEKEGMVILHKK